MATAALWEDVLCHAGRKAHIVQFYQDDGFLARGVACYLGEGFRRNDSAVLIVTPSHWTLIRNQLGALDVQVEDLERAGRLIVLDAKETLSGLLKEGIPDRGLFQAQVAERLRKIEVQAGNAEVRAYGEMVDLLWQEGRPEAAIELERLWNDLMRDERCSLLCSYKVDPWDARLSERQARGIFLEHSHLIPVEDYERLNHSVHQAMDEVFGKSQMTSLRPLIAANKSRLPVMPGAQAAILWVRDNLPHALQAILERAQRHYQGAGEASLSPA